MLHNGLHIWLTSNLVYLITTLYIQCILLAAVLSRDLIAGYFHTYAEAGMSSIQCALGEGHMTRHEDLLRMDYANATCLMDCVKPNIFKVHTQWLPYNVYCF